MAIKLVLLLVAVSTCPAATSSGQSGAPDGPAKGIVWSPTGPFANVRTDMQEMALRGANAVRLTAVLDTNIHVVADLFDLTLYQELDARFLPAARLPSHREEIVTTLDSVLDVASYYEAQHRFGLGYWIDTSVPATCDFIRDLAARVHRRIPDAKTYYVSAFVESDLCSDAVDFVLLEATDTVAGRDMIRRWRAHSDTPVGIAGVGFQVREDTKRGYEVRYSPEYQARMLEIELSRLLDDSKLEAVFVNRWRAQEVASNDLAGYLGDFGIIGPGGSPRPAAAVVKGLYTGDQSVFAYDAGERSGNDYSWINLVSFLSVALFGLTYYGSMGLRSIVRRYFLSHSIYLEKLSDGREATVGTSLFLLLCLSIAASIVGMTVLTDLSGTRLWHPLLHWLPTTISEPLKVGAARSGLLVPIFAALFGFVTLLWAGVLSLSTRGAKRIRFGQALLTAVMPRWPVALIGLLALVMLNWQFDAPGLILIAVMAFWFIVVVVYTGRMLSDFLRLLGIQALWTIPVLLLGLMLVAGVVWLVVVTNDLGPELGYLWNLARGT